MHKTDFDTFWKEDQKAHENNCFSRTTRQVALGIAMSDECVFAELGEEGAPWGITPRVRRLELNKRYNDKAEKIVGRRLLSETLPPEDAIFPPVLRIGEIFGGQYFLKNETEWLEGTIKTPQDLEKTLDQVDKLDLESALFPANWRCEAKRIYETYGLRPSQLRWVRGPVTLACSLMGCEEFIYLLLDAPELGMRFSRTIARVAIQMAELMDNQAGYTKETAPHGFGFADDSCCLLTPELYEAFGYPILQEVFARFSPNKEDSRYQHSDSPMGHLIPILARLELTGVNFGPTVLIPQIREHMKTVRIEGCLAPFTFMRNDLAQIQAEVKRDLADARAHGGGLCLSTAGSINNGSLLTSMAHIMEFIAEDA